MQVEYKIEDCIIRLTEGDVTELDVDAIVNAANEQLILGSGVAGAIREKGGPSIQEECNRIGGTHVGGAVITGAGNLVAKHIIHAVGPRMGEGDEELKLEKATINTLHIAVENGLNSVAFPAISTGVFGFPIESCASIMIHTTLKFLMKYNMPTLVVFCLWGIDSYKIFEKKVRENIEIEE